MRQQDWQARMTRVIAGEVRRYRRERGMSAQQLSDETGQQGMLIPRSVLANLENGRRDTISAAEVLVLARALRVPPVLLLVPAGRQDAVEILPSREVPTWDAFRWLTGERWPGMFNDRMLAVLGTPDRQEIELLRDHDFAERAAEQLGAEVRRYTEAAATADTEQLREMRLRGAERTRRELIEMEDRLRAVRGRFRERDLIPPVLPPKLAYIEEGES